MINLNISEQLFYTFTSGIFISAAAAYLGTLMLSRNMSVTAGPLAHLALPGAAIAIVYGWSIFAGVFPFVLIGTILIWILERRTKLPMENLAAIVFAFGVGSALLILPIEEAEAALVGSINTISRSESIIVIIVSSLCLYIAKKIYAKVLLMNINEELAHSTGIRTEYYNFLYLITVGLVVSVSVYLVGGLITAALIAIPSAIGRNISRDLRMYKIGAILAGIAATIIGIYLNRLYHLPTGPLIIVVSSLFFVATVMLGDRLKNVSKN